MNHFQHVFDYSPEGKEVYVLEFCILTAVHPEGFGSRIHRSLHLSSSCWIFLYGEYPCPSYPLHWNSSVKGEKCEIHVPKTQHHKRTIMIYAIPIFSPFHCILCYQPPLYPWNAMPTDIPVVMDNWFNCSEQVWEQAHITHQQYQRKAQMASR